MDFKWADIWWTWRDFQAGSERKCWYYWGLHKSFQCELLQIHENCCREFQETQRKLPNEKEAVNKAKPNNHKNSVHILSRCFLVLYISCFDNHFNCYHTSVQGYDNATKTTTIYHFQVVHFTEKCYCIFSDEVLFFLRKYIFMYHLCHEPNPSVFTQIKNPVNSVLVLAKKNDKIVGPLHVKILISNFWVSGRKLTGVEWDLDKT